MKSSKRGLNINLFAGIFCLTMSALFLYASWTYPKLDRVGLIVGARLFPKIVSVGMLVSSIAVILQALLKPQPREAYTGEEKREYLRALAVIALCIAYVLVMPFLGFLITSVIFTAAAQVIFGNRNIPSLVLVSILFPVALYAAFRYGLSVLLPVGLFGF